MKTINRLFVYSASIFLCGCSGPSYILLNRDQIIEAERKRKVPFIIPGNMPSSNLFSKKGQIKLEGYAGTGYAAGLSYAAGNHLAITGRIIGSSTNIGSVSNVLLELKNSETEEVHTEMVECHRSTEMDADMIEGGMSYYNSNHKFLRYELGGGMAWGSIRNYSTFYLNYINGYTIDSRRMKQYFVNASAGVVRKGIEAALMLRMSSYHFSRKEFDSTIHADDPFEEGAACMEYGFRAGIRLGRATLFYQFNTGTPLIDNGFHWRLTQHTGGLAIRFGERMNNK